MQDEQEENQGMASEQIEDDEVAPGGVEQVSDAEFDALIRSAELPVLVDFYADWCGPCGAMAPVLDALARDLESELKVVKIDTEQHRGVMEAMNVRSLPTLVLFRGTDVIGQKIGALPPHELRRWVEKAIRPKKGLLSRLLGR